jgi:hypothetical protein
MSENKTAIVTVESQRERYAVIGVRWNEFFPEVMLAYGDEESLCEPIAGSSMLGIGFSSREAALAVIPNSSSRELVWHTAGLLKLRRAACAALQHVVAVGILTLYSQCVAGAALRVLVGG